MDNVEIKKGEIRITIPQFKTHVNKNNTKKIKINAQSIYSGVHHYTRGKIVGQMHTHIKKHIPEDLDLGDMLPISICMEMHVPKNYEGVKYIKGELRWKKPADDHKPSWDADNQWLWIKCFQDSLTAMGRIPDDTVMYIPDTGRVVFIPVDSLEKRKLVFIIKPHASKYKKLWLKYFNYFNK